MDIDIKILFGGLWWTAFVFWLGVYSGKLLAIQAYKQGLYEILTILEHTYAKSIQE